MSSQDNISELLEKWLRLTEAETASIQADAWTDLENIQLAKQTLQRLISQAMQSEENANRFESDFQHLVALESRNRELLARKIENAAESKDSLQRSARNLRRIHHTYARKPDAAWNSYS